MDISLIIKIMIGIFFLIVLVKIGMQPYIFSKVALRDINFFLYVLLYRGEYEKTLLKNGSLFISKNYKEREIVFLKYKEKGKIGLYFLIPFYDDLDDLETKILKKINKLPYYFEESPEKNVEKVMFVDIGQDVDLAQELLEYTVIEIFKIKIEERLFDVHFWNINPDFTEIMGFSEDDLPDFKELGVEIRIPVLKATCMVSRISTFIARLLGRI